MAELKLCPFCGRTPTVDDCGDHRYFVRCKCGIAQDKLYAQKCDAVRRWNTRMTLAAAQPQSTIGQVNDTAQSTNDCISRQEAIDSMCELMHHWFGCDPKDEIREIKRELGKLPSAQPDVPDTNVGDTISRQAAIDAVCMEWCNVKHQDCKHPFDYEKDDYYWCDGCETVLKTLPDLPAAQPQRGNGNWVCIDGINYECDQCGCVLEDWIKGGGFFNYCPNCGAQMEGHE